MSILNNNNNLIEEEFEDDVNFDMFDITTGNIIACDNSPPIYDTTIRWNSSINAKLEKSVHEAYPTSNKFNEVNSGGLYMNSSSNITRISQLISETTSNNNNINNNNIINSIGSIDNLSNNSNSSSSSLDIDINHKFSAESCDIVECKDMNSISKVQQLQPYVQEIFDVSCVRFYTLIIDSDFWSLVSKEMGFFEMNEGVWKSSSEQCHQERLLSFKSPISFKIGPKVASVTQVQKVRRTPTNGYFMETSSVSKDVPYGDNFSVENYISLEPHGADQSILKVSTAVKFTKSIWGLTSLIEKTVIQSNKDFFQVWSSMAKKRVLEQKLLQSTTKIPPPVKQPQKQPILPIHKTIPTHITSNLNISNNTNILLDKDFTKRSEYEEMKQLFYTLFKEVQEQSYQQPKTIKIISVLTNQHIANVTIQFKHTVSDLIQYLIPFTLPNLHPSQYFEIFWLDKKNEFSQFFFKDLDQQIFNFVNNNDAIGICTVTEFQALKKSLSFVIVDSGKKATIKYNPQLDKGVPF